MLVKSTPNVNSSELIGTDWLNETISTWNNFHIMSEEIRTIELSFDTEQTHSILLHNDRCLKKLLDSIYKNKWLIKVIHSTYMIKIKEYHFKQGCQISFLKAKSGKFGLIWNCLPEIKWFGHFLAFLNVDKKVYFKACFGQIWANFMHFMNYLIVI